MKKDYMKPAAKAVVMNLNENIALSMGTIIKDSFGVYYRVVGDNRYIHTSTVKASSTGNAEYDAFVDLWNAFWEDVEDICSYDPDHIESAE